MNPSERLLALYSMLLFSGREVSRQDLARELDCSPQTIDRDLAKLESSNFGKLLCEKRGREARFRLARPARLPRISLDAEGLWQLALCRAFLLHLLPERMRQQTRNVLRQASAYAAEDQGRENQRRENDQEAAAMEDASGAGSSAARGAIDYTPFEDSLETLTDAIRRHRVCRVRYRAAAGSEAKEYFFAPKKLIAFHEAIYVRGWVVSDSGRAVQKYGGFTDLAVQRLLKARLTQRHAEHLPEVRDGGEDFGIMDGEPFRVSVRFLPSAAAYASERIWSEDQSFVRHRDGSATLTMTARNDREVLSWVLSFAGTAELLSPRRLRDEVSACVRKLAALYEVDAQPRPVRAKEREGDGEEDSAEDSAGPQPS